MICLVGLAKLTLPVHVVFPFFKTMLSIIPEVWELTTIVTFGQVIRLHTDPALTSRL